jgi:hypothetical protein
MFSVAEDAINIQTDILLTSKLLLLFTSWDSLSSYFAGEKKVWRCSSFSSVSSLARFVVVECREKCSFFSVSWADFFFPSWLARFVYFDFFYVAIEVAHIPTLILFFSLPKTRMKSVILVLRKVADVFKLNDEKWSHFLIDEIFQVAMFLQWNLIVEHPKIF